MRSLGDLAGYRRQVLEKEGGGAAFTLRSVTGNAQPAFRLHQPGRMTDKRGVDRLSSRRNKADPMIDAPYGCGAVGASLHRGRKARLPAKHPVTFRSAHHAMVLAIPPAAGRQICFAFRRKREKRGNKWQAEHGQQHHGDKRAHVKVLRRGGMPHRSNAVSSGLARRCVLNPGV